MIFSFWVSANFQWRFGLFQGREIPFHLVRYCKGEPGMCDSERKIPSIHKLTQWLRLESLGALLHYIIPQPSVGSGMGKTLVTKVSPVRLLYTLELKYPIVMGERKIKTVKLAFLRFYTPMSP